MISYLVLYPLAPNLPVSKLATNMAVLALVSSSTVLGVSAISKALGLLLGAFPLVSKGTEQILLVVALCGRILVCPYFPGRT